jgi:hypothetical protein
MFITNLCPDTELQEKPTTLGLKVIRAALEDLVDKRGKD